MRMEKVTHRRGWALLHRGQHRHGAMEVEGDDSARHNLIIWCRSSSVRNQLCPMCDRTPVLVPRVGYGDGFLPETVEMCSVN